MKRVLLILGLVSVIMFPNTILAGSESTNWMKYTYIAHALGGLGTDYHINSVDAFNQAYKNGFKGFETDLLLTSDDKLVAVHDWSGYTTPPTYAQFMSSKVLGKYTPTDVDQILELMETHPDMYLDTDTKETDPTLIRKQSTFLHPYIFHFFKNTGFSIIREIIPRENIDFFIELKNPVS